MSSAVAAKRLHRDYADILKDPIPMVVSKPSSSDILHWHFVIEGPKDSPYHGGYYHGELFFPPDYPFKPPKILMRTPNGRFKTNMPLCFSMSHYHPETWNPSWAVSTILTGFLSFMLDTAPTYGSISTSVGQTTRLARRSLEFNLMNEQFQELFPEIVKEIEGQLENQLDTISEAVPMPASSLSYRHIIAGNEPNVWSVPLNWVLLVAGLIFGFVVDKIINYY